MEEMSFWILLLTNREELIEKGIEWKFYDKECNLLDSSKVRHGFTEHISTKKLDLKKANLRELRNLVSTEEWEPILQSRSEEREFKTLKEALR